MNDRILITGGLGFVGRHMSAYLAEKEPDIEIICVDIEEKIKYQNGIYIKDNLLDSSKIDTIIKTYQPRWILHLASIFNGKSFDDFFQVNVTPIKYILQSVKRYSSDTIVISFGSAAEYGDVGEMAEPINEMLPCIPNSPYGITKLLATEISKYYSRVEQIRVLVIRPFQIIGQHISNQLAPGAFFEKIVKLKDAHHKVIRVGNLDSYRDFIDISDVIEAIWLLCNNFYQGQVVNICSGKAVHMANLLDMMIQVSGVKVEEIVTENFGKKRQGRAEGVSKIFGDFKMMETHCGWRPKISLLESIEKMFA